MTSLKKGTKVLVKGRQGIHTISTGSVTSGSRVRVKPASGKSFQVASSSIRTLTPSQLRLVAQYEKLMSW